MENRFFSHLRKYGILAVKYSFFLFNLVLLTGLGIKTISLWISDPFVFTDTLAAFPEEPEFLNKKAAENQFWLSLSIETLLFIIGGFLCYELLIKQKTPRRSLIASTAIVFLWTAGESIPLFFPATEKAQQINACKAFNISWDMKDHKCRLMDLELKRFEQLNIAKKSKAPIAKPAVSPAPQTSNGEKTPQTEKNTSSAIVTPVQKNTRTPVKDVSQEKKQIQESKQTIKIQSKPRLKKRKQKTDK